MILFLIIVLAVMGIILFVVINEKSNDDEDISWYEDCFEDEDIIEDADEEKLEEGMEDDFD